MDVLASPDFDDHEEVVLVARKTPKFAAIIAIHSTRLGPACGGCRQKRYASADEALGDALKLSRAMTYKNALAGLDAGGGKAVLYEAGAPADRAAAFEALGEAIERLGGRYVTAEDVGVSLPDMHAAGRRTRYVTGLPAPEGMAGGDPAPWTALGVFLCIEQLLGGSVRGRRVALQGAGAVGAALGRLLIEAGARLAVADVSASRAEALVALGAELVEPEAIHRAAADVFAPCALGAVLSAETIPELGAPVVCGAANNQLAGEEDGARLMTRGVVYAPDYLVNAGGVICVCAQYLGQAIDSVRTRVNEIPLRLRHALEESRRTGAPPNAVADAMARARLAGAAPGAPLSRKG